MRIAIVDDLADERVLLRQRLEHQLVAELIWSLVTVEVVS